MTLVSGFGYFLSRCSCSLVKLLLKCCSNYEPTRSGASNLNSLSSLSKEGLKSCGSTDQWHSYTRVHKGNFLSALVTFEVLTSMLSSSL